MKKKIKLNLEKEIISDLSDNSMNAIRGGKSVLPDTRRTVCPYTQQPECAVPHTEQNNCQTDDYITCGESCLEACTHLSVACLISEACPVLSQVDCVNNSFEICWI